MRELLQQALEALDVLLAQRSGGSWMQERADKIRAELARTSWVKVSDELPVVPEGEYSAAFWICEDLRRVRAIRIFKHETAAELTALLRNYTHWQYRQDDTPAPPEDL